MALSISVKGDLQWQRRTALDVAGTLSDHLRWWAGTAWRTSRLARLTLCRSWVEFAVAAGASPPTAATLPPCEIG